MVSGAQEHFATERNSQDVLAASKLATLAPLLRLEADTAEEGRLCEVDAAHLRVPRAKLCSDRVDADSGG